MAQFNMNKPLNTPIPISELKDDPKIQDIMKKIESGEISLNTGDPDEPIIWTPEDEARLDAALALMFERNKKDKND